MKGIKGWLEAPENKQGLFIYIANKKIKLHDTIPISLFISKISHYRDGVM